MQTALTAKGTSDIDRPEMLQKIMNLTELSVQTAALELLTFLYVNSSREISGLLHVLQ